MVKTDFEKFMISNGVFNSKIKFILFYTFLLKFKIMQINNIEYNMIL